MSCGETAGCFVLPVYMLWTFKVMQQPSVLVFNINNSGFMILQNPQFYFFIYYIHLFFSTDSFAFDGLTHLDL